MLGFCSAMYLSQTRRQRTAAMPLKGRETRSTHVHFSHARGLLCGTLCHSMLTRISATALAACELTLRSIQCTSAHSHCGYVHNHNVICNLVVKKQNQDGQDVKGIQNSKNAEPTLRCQMVMFLVYVTVSETVVM